MMSLKTKGTTHNTSRNAAFTLIELSIVLVIIGLLVGGVLVGRDLIKSAEIRSQISQLQQYQAAINTFKAKMAIYRGIYRVQKRLLLVYHLLHAPVS